MSTRTAVRRARQLIGLGIAGTWLGIAMGAMAHPEDALTPVAPLITVGSLLVLILGLHRFGRTGADRS